ncbi:molybdopterin dehydrogenase [Thermosipho affectus]|uniref:Molybdopterin dehydrogenase n=1 Tax=Thermosipho affectus TaxID=660294 RepID=A0ABX3IHL8_9BACT|nr:MULTISPECIES: FAD binding domain-containing protein [Thermosipho]ANQ54236.1 molybdopterin dehydrogenase [Thermosipho sp. 1070]APT72681.1 molybdopterin dehydrogenase [Thermosipho sp. 1063]ONN26679.1 molybdopterin dehydrogenase [Thermosipho affectus]
MIKNYYSPSTLDELLKIKNNTNGVVFSGGTDLFVKMRYGIIKPQTVIDTKKIKSAIKLENRKLIIPLNTTYTDLLEFLKKNKTNLFLEKIIKLIGSPMIRNRGTPIGNIANASPAGDFILATYLLNGNIIIKPTNRIIPIENFILGPSKIDLAQNEIIYAIEIDVKNNYKFFFEKVGKRNAMIISIASIAVLLKENNGKIEDISICFGSVSPTILRDKNIESKIIGEEFSIELFKYLANEFEKLSKPINDVRASKSERKKLVYNLTIKAFYNLKNEVVSI